MNLKIIDQLFLYTEEVLIELTTDGTVTYISDNWEKMTGLPAKNILNHLFLKYLFEEEVKEFRHYLQSDKKSFSQKLNISINHQQQIIYPFFCKIQNEKNHKVVGKLRFVSKPVQTDCDLEEPTINIKEFSIKTPFNKEKSKLEYFEDTHSELINTNKMLKQITETAKIGGWEYNLKNKKLEWTDEVYHIYELPLNFAITLDKSFDYFYKDYRNSMITMFNKLIEHGIEFNATLKLKTHLGNLKWVKVIGKAAIKKVKHEKFYGIIQDISEQMKKVTEIEEGKERFHLMSNNTRGLICTHQVDSTYKYVSPSIKRLLGYKESDIIGKKPFDFIFENDIEIFKTELFEKVLAGENPLIQHRFKRNDNTVIWFETIASPIIDENEVTGFISYSRDITEKLKDEKALQKSEHRLKLALNAGKMGIWEWMIPEDKWLLSDNMKDLLKMKNKTFNGSEKNILSHIHPKDRSSFINSLKSFSKSGAKNWKATHRVISKNEEDIWLEWNGELYLDKDGNSECIIGTASDISARVKYEKEVRKLALVARSTINAVLITDKQCKIEWVNEGFERLTGFSLEEVMGKYPGKILWGEETDVHEIERIENAIKNQQIVKSELINYTKERKKIWLELNIQPVFDSNGEIERYIFIKNDLSRYKEQEEAMKLHNDDLRKANEELDNFVYRVSHDLRAPISSSMGLLDVIKMEGGVGGGDQYIELLYQSMIRMDNFIQDILNYSRNARMPLNVEKFDLTDILDETLAHYKFIYKDKVLREIIDYERGIMISTDRLRLSIVLSNVISNVFKFFNQAEEDPYIWISVSEEKDRIQIIIADNGIGIQKEFELKVFEMFFRATNRNIGSGLGLYIAKETIEKIGGVISLKSVYEKGTTLTLHLPKVYRYGFKLEL